VAVAVAASVVEKVETPKQAATRLCQTPELVVAVAALARPVEILAAPAAPAGSPSQCSSPLRKAPNRRKKPFENDLKKIF
jgi:hypothetical protein